MYNLQTWGQRDDKTALQFGESIYTKKNLKLALTSGKKTTEKESFVLSTSIFNKNK